MWVRFLRDRAAPLVAALSSDIGTFRLLAVVAQPTLLAFFVFIKTDSFDPIWPRIVLAGLFALVFALSFFVPWLVRHIRHFTHLFLFAVCSWLGTLALINDLEGQYVIGYLTLLLFSGINFKNALTLFYFVLANVGIGAAAFIAVPDHPGAAAVFLLMVLMLVTMAYVGLAFRLTIERELRRTSDLLNSILQNSPDGILIVSHKSFMIMAYNPNAEKMIGMEGNPEGLKAHLGPILKDLRAELREGQTALRRELQLTRADGSNFWAEVMLSEIESGSRRQLLCSITDITTRIKAEQSLRLSDHILHEVDHLVIVCNEDAQIIYLSPAVERILGYQNERLLGNGWWETPLRPMEEHLEERNLLISTLQGKYPVRSIPYERAYRTVNGAVRWVQWRDALTHDNLLISMGMEHTEERHNSLLRSVIFNIAEASSKVKTPGEFYKFIHQEIRRVIDTPNFYIAVYDQVKDIVFFPYYADAADTKLPFSRKAGKGLTELTIRSKKPLLASKAQIAELDANGFVDLKGQTIPEVWLGVPLVHDDEVVGLITIQDYSRSNAYTADDLALLTFIAGQVAQFVSKLQSDEALRLSEERFRAIYDHSAVGIAQITLEGRYLRVNQRLCEIFGYSDSEITQMTPLDITYPEDYAVGQKELEGIRNGKRDTYTVEKRYVHREGHLVHARVNVSAYREDGKIQFIISVYEDITERIRAQEETAMLFSLSNALNVTENNENALLETLEHVLRQGTWEYGEAWVRNPDQSLSLVELRTANVIEGQVLPSVTDGPFVPDTDEIFWLEETDLHTNEYPRSADFLRSGFNTVSIIPLVVEGHLHAVLLLAARRRWEANERNLRVLSAARAQLRTFMLRKFAEQAQKESEARYKAITEAAFEGIAIHRQGRILEANSAFANLFAYDQDHLVGLSILDLAADGESRTLLQQIEGGEGSVNLTGKKRDGETMYLEAVGRPGTWEGAAAGIVAVRDITHEKLMEEARETARLDARFRVYVQNSTEIILILDEAGEIQYSSPTLERYTGLEPEAVVGTDLYRLLHPSEVITVRSLLERVMDQPGASEKAGLRLSTEDGEWRNFQMAFTNLLEDAMVKGILVSAHDITDLKRTEAAVLENETKFRAIFSQANDAILVLEARAIIECNDMAEEMYGLPREQLLGTTLADFSPPEQPDGSNSRAKLHAKMGDALDGNYQYFTWKHRRSDGVNFDAEISMSQIRIGEKLFLQCVVRDITERVLAENALRESERRNKAILDAIPDLMLRIDDQGQVLDYKAADQQALILASDTVMGGNIAQLLPDVIVEHVMDTVPAAIAAGEGRQYENELMIAGDPRDFETRIVRSGPFELLVIIRDVTERKRTEKELLKRNFELDSFVYRASHDLKAPLNSLMGLISIMGSENDDPMVQNYLRMMNKSVVKLDNFIRDLADFSRNDRVELERSLVDWKPLVSETLENLRFMETADRVQKIIDIKAEGEFYSDAVRIGIVMGNLVSNAIKYQNLRRDGAYVKIEVESNPDHATIRVSDNGIGISEEHLEKVFNLFFRASVQSYGSGMGMYIVKNAVDRLRGTIHVESTLDAGSCFTVTIPNMRA